MRDGSSWISRAEEYCRAEGVDKIVHPNKKYLYDLQGVGDEVIKRRAFGLPTRPITKPTFNGVKSRPFPNGAMGRGSWQSVSHRLIQKQRPLGGLGQINKTGILPRAGSRRRVIWATTNLVFACAAGGRDPGRTGVVGGRDRQGAAVVDHRQVELPASFLARFL